MNRKRLLGSLLLLAVSDRSFGQVPSEDLAPDARALGMGGAFTAVAEGPAAVWWNPGALALTRRIVVSPFSRRQLVPDVSDDVRVYGASGTVGLGLFGLGVHFSDLDLGESPLIDIEGNTVRTFKSSEYTLHLGAGFDLGRLVASESTNFEWGLGGAFKYSSVDVGASLFGFDSTGTGWDMDLGTLAVFRFPVQITSGEDDVNYVAIRGGLKWRSILGREVEFDPPVNSDPFEQSVTIAVASEVAMFSTASAPHFLRAILSLEDEELLGIPGSIPGTQRLGLELSVGLPADAPILFLEPRVGYINDRDNDIQDVAYGGGLGGNISLGRSTIGGRFDYAGVPQATDLARTNQYTLSAWVNY